MDSYHINPDGSKTIYGRYARIGVLKLSAVFPRDPVEATKFLKKKKTSKGTWRSKYKVKDKTQIVRQIFISFLTKVIERVIDGDLYMFPGITKTHMVVKAIRDVELRTLRKQGKYKSLDLMKTGYKLPAIFIDFGPFTRKLDYKLYVPPSMNDRLLKNAENGVLPYITIPKTLDRDVQYEKYNDGDL